MPYNCKLFVLRIFIWIYNTGEYDFYVKKQNTFFSEFDDADSENNQSFSWLATVFAVLQSHIFGKKIN